MAKPVVFVIGASGNAGSATIQKLGAKYADRVEIRAGVRNPDKADKLKSIAGVSVVKAEMATAELENTLKDVHALFIVTPGAVNRTQLTISTAEYAKKAGVNHLVLVSGSTAEKKETITGGQMEAIETAVKALGVPYTFLRLPLFFSYYFGTKDTVKSEGVIYAPIDPTKPFFSVADADIGNAAASVLVDPTQHANKTYNIVCEYLTYPEIAAIFSEVLGKTVSYNRVPYEVTKKAMLEWGIPELLVNGLEEAFKMIDNEDPILSNFNTDDYQKITGETPIKLGAWLAQVKEVFQ